MGSTGVGKTSFISRLLDNCLADEGLIPNYIYIKIYNPEPFTKRIHFSPDNRRKSYVVQAVVNSQERILFNNYNFKCNYFNFFK